MGSIDELAQRLENFKVVSGAVEELPRMLLPDEEVKQLFHLGCLSFSDMGPGLGVFTDQRLLVVRTAGMLRRRTYSVDIPYASVGSISQSRPDFVAVSHDGVEDVFVASNGRDTEFMRDLRKYVSEARSGASSQARSVPEQLTQLAALRASGALTEAEFQSQKAKLLL